MSEKSFVGHPGSDGKKNRRYWGLPIPIALNKLDNKSPLQAACFLLEENKRLLDEALDEVARQEALGYNSSWMRISVHCCAQAIETIKDVSHTTYES